VYVLYCSMNEEVVALVLQFEFFVTFHGLMLFFLTQLALLCTLVVSNSSLLDFSTQNAISFSCQKLKSF
jgi:hypothetical protein